MTIVVFVMVLDQSTIVDVMVLLKENVTVMETYLMNVVFVEVMVLLMSSTHVTVIVSTILMVMVLVMS